MLTVTSEAQHRIDVYLTKLRSRLRAVDEQDIRDIVEELRSHIIDKTAMAAEDRSVDKVGETLDALTPLSPQTPAAICLPSLRSGWPIQVEQNPFGLSSGNSSSADAARPKATSAK